MGGTQKYNAFTRLYRECIFILNDSKNQSSVVAKNVNIKYNLTFRCISP